MKFSLKEIEEEVTGCRACPRLVAFRENVLPRASFQDEVFWRKPVPGFGDPHASLMILGLAPAPQGGNRTGRIFTGDESGRFLMEALFKAGFANQSTSQHRGDGLKLINCYITAAVKCAPPKHHPLSIEFKRCSKYLENEFFLLKNTKAILALGGEAFKTALRFYKQAAGPFPGVPFSHGVHFQLEGWPSLYGSYHPSPQNTYTRKLTSEMMVSLLNRIKEEM